MESTKDKDHFLTLKVMRLTKPSISPSFPVLCCDINRDLPQDSFFFNSNLEYDVTKQFENISLGECLILPQNFGNIFLGENFSSYISVNNDSQYICTDVQIKIELQTGTQRLVLTGVNTGQVMSQLLPAHSIDEVVHHEIKELGTQILICAVSYTNPGQVRMYFRKFFKFHVLKPLDVKTKFYNIDTEDVYLEAQIQNITQGSIFLEKVYLDPIPGYKVDALTFDSEKKNSDDSNPAKLFPIFEPYICVNSQDTRQFLYILSPIKSTNLSNIQPSDKTKENETQKQNLTTKGISSIGKLDIVWKSSMGEKGRLQTSQLQKVAPGCGDIKVNVVQCPAICYTGDAVTMTIDIINCCERPMDLIMNLQNNNSIEADFNWTGLSNVSLGTLQILASLQINCTFVPISTGLMSISGLHLTDVCLKRTYENDDIFQILVLPP